MASSYYESSVGLDIVPLRRYVLILLSECTGGTANLLREQVRNVHSTDHLLKMRSAIFECMSMHLGEAEAMERIRSLDLSARPPKRSKPSFAGLGRLGLA